MNYRNQNLRELLAGEYVLGTLRGPARRRFERLLMEDGRLRAEVTFWEERFTGWTAGLAPIRPRAVVWHRLLAKLKGETTRGTRSTLPKLLQIWAGGAVAAAALVIIGVLTGRNLLTPVPPSPTYLAVMSSPQSGPRWLITVDSSTRRVGMKALADNTPPPGKSYELWMLPVNGTPVPMGLMNPTGSASETISPEAMYALSHAKGLAVSLEPFGGSPTGQPTGPVVFTATIVNG